MEIKYNLTGTERKALGLWCSSYLFRSAFGYVVSFTFDLAWSGNVDNVGYCTIEMNYMYTCEQADQYMCILTYAATHLPSSYLGRYVLVGALPHLFFVASSLLFWVAS